MSKFLVDAVQIITQQVVFEVEAADEVAARALFGSPEDTVLTIYDSEDENYLANIVLGVSSVDEETAEEVTK